MKEIIDFYRKNDWDYLIRSLQVMINEDPKFDDNLKASELLDYYFEDRLNRAYDDIYDEIEFVEDADLGDLDYAMG